MAIRNVHKEDINLIGLPEQALAEDRGLEICGKPQRVLADTADANLDRNDRTALAYLVDTMVVELEDAAGNLTTALGEAISFPYQADAKGFVIDWRQHVTGGSLAVGCYKVKVSWTKDGFSDFFYVGSYDLKPYTRFNAENTVQLIVQLNDVVRHQGINYKDSGFSGTIRFKGTFGEMQPNYEIENITYSDRTRNKVRIEALRTYVLQSDYVLNCITQLLDEEFLLTANRIFVTENDRFAHRQYKLFPIILSEEESPVMTYEKGSPYANLKAVFLDRKAFYESKYDGNIPAVENVLLNLPTIITSETVTSIIPYSSGDVGSSFTVVSGGDMTVNTITTTLTTFAIKVNTVTKTVPFDIVATDLVEMTFDSAPSDGQITLS